MGDLGHKIIAKTYEVRDNKFRQRRKVWNERKILAKDVRILVFAFIRIIRFFEYLFFEESNLIFRIFWHVLIIALVTLLKR